VIHGGIQAGQIEDLGSDVYQITRHLIISVDVLFIDVHL